MFGFKKIAMPSAAEALPGRADADPHRERAFRQSPPAQGALSGGLETAMFGLGCFWGAETQVLGTGRRASTSPRSAMPAA